MRRLALIVLALAAAGTGATLLAGASAQGSSSARFDVIFDDARGLVGGQVVKIAGARAGTIQNVVVTPDFKARVEGEVDSRFMPFRQNATCTIRPEGLIAENYVDCDPGTAPSPPLKASGSHPPTVPVTNTTEPVGLLDLFNMFDMPTRDRFQAIVNELGIGTAGRGSDFNDILRRANPTLALARQAISILARQKNQLATIVDATNTIAAQGATHTADLQRFLERVSSLTSLTAAHRDPLSQTVARLPALLAAAEPALRQLDTVAVDGTPLLSQIHVAVPSLNRVSSDLGPFVSAAKPALAKMTVALRQAIPAIRNTTPMVRTLLAYTRRSLPGTKLFARLASNLQQHGFAENFLSVTYYIAASLARFDSISHMLSILLVGPGNGTCGNYATKPVAGCQAHYGSQPSYQSSSASKARNATRTAAVARRTQAPSAHAPAAGSPTTHSGPTPAARPQVPGPAAPATSATAPVQQTEQTLQSLTQYLLK